MGLARKIALMGLRNKCTVGPVKPGKKIHYVLSISV